MSGKKARPPLVFAKPEEGGPGGAGTTGEGGANAGTGSGHWSPGGPSAPTGSGKKPLGPGAGTSGGGRKKKLGGAGDKDGGGAGLIHQISYHLYGTLLKYYGVEPTLGALR